MTARLLPLLQWLDEHPSLYLLTVGGLLAAALARAVGPLLARRPDAGRAHDWWWGTVIFVILAAGRWPSLVFTRELNADESQLLAGARALAGDPIFWRSVNGFTAGPLDFFALWPAGGLLGWDSYLPARITALILLAGGLVLFHQALALTSGRTAARVATLVGTAFEALTDATDWLHYSSELVVLALLAAAAYAAARRWFTTAPRWWAGLGGLALGAVPFAKLQGGPLAFLAGVGWLVAEWRSRESDRSGQLAWLLGGALFTAAFLAVQLTLTKEWTSFWLSYVRFNLFYTSGDERSLADTLRGMLGYALAWDRFLPYAGFGSLLWLALLVRVRPAADVFIRWTGRLAGLACLVALASILLPHRPFLHYWQLLLLPAVWLLATSIARVLAASPGDSEKLERQLIAGGAIALVGLMLLVRSAYPNLFVGEMAHFWSSRQSPLAARVATFSHPGEKLAIWGRGDSLYVEAGLIQATRDSHGQFILEAGPLQEYFRARYLRDFLSSQPALFIDLVRPNDRHYRDPGLAHDRSFPSLADVIRQDYLLIDRFEGTRIYRRKDLAGR